MKIGKLAAFMGGSGLIFILLAKHQGYLRTKSNKFGEDVVNVKKNLQVGLNYERSGSMIVAFFKDRDVYLSGGFVAGSLFGISFS